MNCGCYLKELPTHILRCKIESERKTPARRNHGRRVAEVRVRRIRVGSSGAAGKFGRTSVLDADAGNLGRREAEYCAHFALRKRVRPNRRLMHPAAKLLYFLCRPIFRAGTAARSDMNTAFRIGFGACRRTAVMPSKILEIAAFNTDIDLSNGIFNHYRNINPLTLSNSVFHLTILRILDV